MPALPFRPSPGAASSAGLACALLAAACGPAVAADQDPQARAWAASCITCHAPAARPMPAILPLEGLSPDWIATRMRTLAAASSEAGVMAQIARGYSDDEIVRIARWFAARPKAEAP
ncbi:c-type cytochrome [Achromobacter sp. NPDC058515]|uniref:c-type cytochrome n=1 Tax=Achromobacter sp. NPDC058515 TaxID=3346533 RepID=UPI0036507A04